MHFSGHKTWMSVTMGGTILQVVHSALRQEGIEIRDFYLKHNGRMLDGYLLIDSIPNLVETNIDVCPRIRGGR